MPKLLIEGREYDQVSITSQPQVAHLWELREQTGIGMRRLDELERTVRHAQRALKAAQKAGDEAAAAEHQGAILDAGDVLFPVTVFLSRRNAGDKGTFLELIACTYEVVPEDGDDVDVDEVEAPDPTTAGPASGETPDAGASPAAAKTKGRRSTTSASRSSSGSPSRRTTGRGSPRTRS